MLPEEPDGAYAYVALDNSNKVLVISTATKALVNQITVTPRSDPYIFVGPAGTDTANRLYVTSWARDFGCGPDGQVFQDTRRISVVDITNPLTATEVAVIPVEYGTEAMAISPDGLYGYAIGCSPNWDVLHKIDLVAAETDDDSDDDSIFNEAIASLPLSRPYGNVEVTPDGAYALVSASDCVLVIDLGSFSETGNLCGIAAGAWGIEINDAGTRAYVTDANGQTLLTLDTSGLPNLALLSTVPVAGTDPTSQPIQLQLAGNKVYLVATPSYYELQAEVIEFDVSQDVAVQGCSAPVGNGGFELAVLGEGGEWNCSDAPPVAGKWYVKGTGHLAGNRNIHFEVHARWTKSGFKGQCNVQDGTTKKGRKIRCLDVTEMIQVGNEIVIRGNALDGKTATTYEIRVADNGKSGRNSPDVFAITTGSGYSAGPDTLWNGDIRIKPITPKGGSHKHDGDCEHEDD